MLVTRCIKCRAVQPDGYKQRKCYWCGQQLETVEASWPDSVPVTERLMDEIEQRVNEGLQAIKAKWRCSCNRVVPDDEALNHLFTCGTPLICELGGMSNLLNPPTFVPRFTEITVDAGTLSLS